MTNECPKCQTNNPDTVKFCGDCGTSLEADVVHTKTLETPTEELTRGSVFAGRYEIIEELGKGGMGRVYRVEDKKIKKEIALKLIKPEVASDKKTIERFKNELTTARDIRHKNVCGMFDLGEEKGQHYITMEYVSGGDLKRFIRRVGQLPPGKAISIAKQISEGLEEAHSLGIVHRDLKPSNIMIDDNGNARIMDFGIARSIKGKGITGSGVMIGTPEYMSPEQAEAKGVDQRSDIYSLGVILYEMTTGRLPFEGDTPLSVAMKHKGENPQNPKEFNPQIPDDVSKVILKCLEKNKDKRYQSAGTLRSELINIEKGLPTSDRIFPQKKPLTSKEITITFGLKKLFIPAVTAAALVIILLLIWQPWGQKVTVPVAQENPSIAVLPFDDLSPQKDQESFCVGLAESLINALSQIRELRIPAITSSSVIKEEGNSIQEIGKRLNVRSVLRGSVQIAENQMRITAQLLSTDDEALIWSKQYNTELKDIFSVQDEICLAIVNELRVNLLGNEKEGLIKHYTENIEAYNLYLQGRFYWNMRTEEGINKAIEYMKTSINLDPKYALAYAGLADAYILLADWLFLGSDEGFSKATIAATKALELDNSLAEAYNSMAVIKYMYDWDWINAEEKFKKAISLNPNYASAHQEYGEYLTCLGRFDEALKEFDLAQKLDPLSPIINAIKAWFFLYSREYDKAIQHCLYVLETDANYRPALSYLGRGYVAKGMYEEALSIYQKIDYVEIGIVLAKMGKKTEAMNFIADLIERSKQSKAFKSAAIAKTYFVLGDEEKGFLWLEKAVEEHDTRLRKLKVAPEYDSVRSDPRFKAILKKMNLE